MAYYRDHPLHPRYRKEVNMNRGERIGAILSMTKTDVQFLDYGTFDGYETCEELGGVASPKLTLDNGTTVWGYQCWWELKPRSNP